MVTSSVFLLPSVPTLLIDEQRGDITEMIEALESAGRRVVAEAPEAFVVASPRWVGAGLFLADDGSRHRSVVDLPGFGVEPRHDCAGHPALARAIVEGASKGGVRCATARRGIDSGASVPLHFFVRGARSPVVPLSIGDGSPEEHRAWGAAVRHALDAWPGRVAFAVGGALSWNQHAFNLRRDVPDCARLDEAVLAALREGRWDAVAGAATRFEDRAQPEAGLRHLEVLRGFLDGDAAGEVLGYEQLPGIGTALVEFMLPSRSEDAGD